MCSEGLDLAESSLRRTVNLVQDFKRTPADQTSLDIEEILLDDYIRTVCNPLKPMLRKATIELEQDVSPNLRIVTCPGIIVQLLTNLISNAERHAFTTAHSLM